MNRIVLFLMILSGSFIYAQGMKFEETNFSAILAKAKKENKLIFMDAYTTWCGPCKMMAKNVFPNEEVGNFYNENFINSKFDMEKGEGLEIAKKYDVKAFPTYLFIDGNGEVVYRGTGYYEKDAFIKIGKEANNPSNQMSVLKKKFEEGEKDPEFLKNMIKVYAFSDADLATKAAVRYFEGKQGQPLTQEDYGYLFNLTADSKSPLYQEIVNRKPELLKVMPENTFNQILKRYQLTTIMSTAYNKDTKKMNDKLFLQEAGKIMTKEEAEKTLTKTKINFAARDKNYPEYQKLALQYYGDGSNEQFSSEELNAVAWEFFEKIDDKPALNKALLWAQQSVKKDENYANTDTLANLYLKTGDKKNAKIWAEKSIEHAKKSGEDYESTQKILDTLK